MTQAPAVSLTGVVVRYGRQVVLNDVSLSVCPGEVVGIRGRNGAGKTTLLRLLVNAFRPNSGRRHGPKHSAYVPAAVEPPALSGRAWLAGMPRAHRTSAEDCMAALGFDGDLASPCRALSFGNARKLLLAEAFSSGERLIVVDEASAGLDDTGVAGLRRLVEQVVEAGAAVVIADQQSRPLPCATRVFRVSQMMLEQDFIDETTVDLTLRGPVVAKHQLLESAGKLGFFDAEADR